MKDRIPAHPGRIQLIPVPGQDGYFDVVRADDPTQAGTPLNKTTLLKDQTAEAIGLTADAVPDEALAALQKNKSETTHTHDASKITSGILPIERGGTGSSTGNAPSATKLQTARDFLVNLASNVAASFNGTDNATMGVSGTLPVAHGGTGNTSGNVPGNAASATKLQTGRTIQVNLASTSAPSFNGTANINPGVYGTLPASHGGTGTTSITSFITNNKITRYTTGSFVGNAQSGKTLYFDFPVKCFLMLYGSGRGNKRVYFVDSSGWQGLLFLPGLRRENSYETYDYYLSQKRDSKVTASNNTISWTEGFNDSASIYTYVALG